MIIYGIQDMMHSLIREQVEKAVAKKAEITDEDKASLTTLLNEGDLDGLESKLKEVKSSIVEPIKFNFEEEMPGCPISSLTWNEKRANLSVLVNYKGYVNISCK